MSSKLWPLMPAYRERCTARICTNGINIKPVRSQLPLRIYIQAQFILTTSNGIQNFGIVYVCLFWIARAIFSYLATVTITGDRAAKFRPMHSTVALTALSSEGSFMCHTYCDTGPLFLRSYPKDSWFSLLNVMLLSKEQSLPILKWKCYQDTTLSYAKFPAIGLYQCNINDNTIS
jgi:hypothetical protein